MWHPSTSLCREGQFQLVFGERVEETEFLCQERGGLIMKLSRQSRPVVAAVSRPASILDLRRLEACDLWGSNWPAGATSI